MPSFVKTATALAVAFLAAGCAHDCSPRAGTPRTNVVLVTIDTLRADHLGCYGGTAARTPELDRLAAEGALFERAWAQAPVTIPSHASILTSLPVAQHGVVHNGGRLARPDLDSLPRAFARAGYRTAAFVGAAHLGPNGPLAPLVGEADVYSAPSDLRRPRIAEETNHEVFRWLRGACRDPFFAWVHYWDPHMPYTPPPPFDRAYYDGDPRDPRHRSMENVVLGWFLHDLTSLRRRLAAYATDVKRLKRTLGISSRRVRQLVLNPVGLHRYAPSADPETLRAELRRLGTAVRRDLPFRPELADWLTGVRDVRFAHAQYAGEVSYVDREIGRLRDELVKTGLAARTVLVVTADHGECLGEHGIYFDHAGLYEPSVRVPLIVWAPGRVPPGRHARPARGIDVAPTVLALAGLPVPEAMRGRDLLAPGGESEPVVTEAPRGTQLMVVDGSWKLIRTLQEFYYVDRFARQTGTEELYDLDADPAEERDVSLQQADVRARLAARLDRWSHDAAYAAHDATPSPAAERVLRALGYVE